MGEWGGVQVAERHRERVGGVVGGGQLGQRQQRLHHPRDLRLARAAVAAHRGLHALGGVGEARHPALAGGEHRHPTRMPHREGGLHVLPEVQLLQRHRGGTVLVDQLQHAAMHARQARLQGGPGGRVDHAPVERTPSPSRGPRGERRRRSRRWRGRGRCRGRSWDVILRARSDASKGLSRLGRAAGAAEGRARRGRKAEGVVGPRRERGQSLAKAIGRIQACEPRGIGPKGGATAPRPRPTGR